MRKTHIITIPLMLMLSACVSQWDMQGHDPKDYFKEHPIKNKVETQNTVHIAHFSGSASKLSGSEIDDVKAQLGDISPMAADSVEITLHNMSSTQARREHLSKLFRAMGYTGKQIRFETSPDIGRGDAKIDITYAQVVLPRCPDWRTSPVTSFSNTHQGNFGCANTVNLGLMAADPRDLEKGEGTTSPDNELATKAIRDYRSGAAASSTASYSSSTDAAASAGQ